MQQKVILKQFIRPAILFVISLLAYVYIDSLIWMPFLILAVFFVAVDVFRADKNHSSDFDLVTDFLQHEPGVLGNYVVDSTDSYGLFLVLNDSPVFVDIKEDKYVNERNNYAALLFENSKVLEENLNNYLKMNPEFSSRQLIYIGLHSTKLDEGEVFWEPEGYTKLRGLEFFSE